MYAERGEEYDPFSENVITHALLFNKKQGKLYDISNGRLCIMDYDTYIYQHEDQRYTYVLEDLKDLNCSFAPKDDPTNYTPWREGTEEDIKGVMTDCLEKMFKTGLKHYKEKHCLSYNNRFYL